MSDSVDKINEFAHNLGDNSKNKRQRAVKTLLSKIEILSKTSKGDFTKENVECIAEGAYKGLQIAINTSDSDYCSSLLKIIASIGNNKYAKNLSIVEKIAQSLMILESEESKTFPQLDEAITAAKNIIFQVRKPATAEEVLVSTTISQYTNTHTSHTPTSVEDSSRAVMITRGAGAILNLHVVYSGWKFPSFIISETDEAYLFELMVHLNMKHTCSMTKLWDALTDFPVHVLVTRTGLLHLLLDVIGSTFTQMDIDADPEGLNPLTAMRWLTKLLQLTQHAYKTQLSGSLCGVVPKSSLFFKNSTDPTFDESHLTEGADDSRITADLAFSTYAIKHPLLPSPSVDPNKEAQLNMELGAATVSPVPSVAGLAFAVCAAVLPRLQSRDVAMGQQVLLTLRTALPMVVEACDVSGSGNNPEGGLNDVPRERLQHLLSKIEQLVSFYEDEAIFNLKDFVSLVSSDEVSTEQQPTSEDPADTATSVYTLKEGIFGLTFLSTVVEIFRIIPAHFISPLSEQSSLPRHLKVGPLTVDLMCKMVIVKSVASLLPHYGDVFVAALQAHDPSVVQNVQRAELLVRTALSFSPRTLGLISAATEQADVVSYLLSQAETVSVLLLDRHPTLESAGADAAGVFHSLSSELENVVATLPVLLLAAHQHDEGQSEPDIQMAYRLILRLIACGSDAHRLLLVFQLFQWVAQSGRGADERPFTAAVMDRLEVDASHRKQLLNSIATPAFVRVLVFSCILRSEQDDCSDVATAASLRTLSLQLIEKISEHMIHQQHESGLEAWVDLLCPLKVIDWHSETGSFTQSSKQQSSSIAAVVLQSSSDIKSTVLFIRRLSEFCAASSDAVARLQHHKSLLLGVFYHHPAIRASCGMKLHREVLGVAESSLPSAAFDRLKSTFGGGNAAAGSGGLSLFGASYDPLKSIHLETEELGHTQDLTLLKINAGSITGRELDVLVSIAFNREAEYNRRSMAVVQMFQFLSTDSNLLQARLPWLVSVVQQLVAALSEVHSHIQEAKEVSDARTNVTTAKAAFALSSVESVSSEECAYFKSLADLFCLLVVNVREVRQRASFEGHADPTTGSISMVTPLRCFLGVSLLGNSLAGGIAKEIQEAEKYVGGLCGQALSVVCLSTEGWAYVAPARNAADEADLFSHKYSAPPLPAAAAAAAAKVLPFVKSSKMKMKLSEVSSVYQLTSVLVPAALSASFRCIKPSTVPYVWSKAQLKVRSAGDDSLPPYSMLAAVIDEHYMTDNESIQVLTVAKLFNLLAEAKSHADLRSALTLTKCLGTSYPPLFRLFVDFKLSLVTALSSIIVNLPRSPKDHVTLSQTLQFLTVVFHQLQQGAALFTAGVEAVNEAVSALVPSMGEYFRENVTSQYRKKFKTGAEELEFARVNQSIQLHYLELLFVLSGFCHSHLNLSEHLLGSYIWSYCVQSVLYNETAASHVKALVAGMVENCLLHHKGLILIQSLNTKKTDKSDSSSSSSVIESILRSVKLLRAPNSMQCNHALVSNMRILYLLLQQLTTSGSERSPILTALVSRPAVEWRFLVRLIYDRRAEVKLLALQILTILFEHVPNETDNKLLSESILNDSLDNNDVEPVSEDVDTSAEASAATAAAVDAQRENHQWPPYEMLYNVMADTSECRAVRVSAIRAVLRCVRFGARNDRINYYVILTALSDVLSLTGSQTCAMSLEEGMELLSSLLVHAAAVSLKEASDILALIRSMKVLPTVVELLRSDLLQVLTSRATDRVSKEVYYTHPEEDAIQFDSEYIIREPTTLVDNVSDLLHNKWIAAGTAYRARTCDSVRLVQASACRILLLAKELGARLGGEYAGLFEDCIRFSRMVDHVLANLSNLKDILDPFLTPQQLEFEMLWHHAHAELLTVLITATEAVKAQAVLEKFLLAHVDVVPDMTKQIILYLRHMLSHPALLSSSQSGSSAAIFVKCIDGVFYLLAVMLNDPVWRGQLDLGGPFEGCEISQLSEYLFTLVLTLRDDVVALQPTSDSAVELLLTKIDLTISLFLQHSFATRDLVVYEDEEDVPDCLVKKCLAVVSSAAEFLSNPRNAVSPTPPTAAASSALPSSGASVVSLASTSQASTVNIHKGAAAAAAAAGSKKTGGVRMSTSTLGSKSATASNSKWREKTRSYAWNDDKSKDGTAASAVNKVNMASIEFTPAFKLQLYNALMILTYALPENPLAMIIASKHGLHQSLNKLLRYAARHSLSVSLTSATTSVLHQLDKSQTNRRTSIGSSWKPSSGQIASALYALACSYTLDSNTTKSFLMNAGENPATVLNGNAGSGHILHHFVSIGTNKSILHPVRWLCLTLTSSLVGSVKQQQQQQQAGAGVATVSGLSSSLGSTLATTTAMAIQRIAQNPFSDSTEALYYLINCLTAFIASNSERLSSSTLSSQNVFYNTTLPTAAAAADGKTPGSDMKLEPFESLTVWVYDNFNHQPEVLLALCRCLGVITNASGSANTALASFSVASSERKRTAGVNLSSLMGEALISILCNAVTESRSLPVIESAYVSLWTIVHQSEKARMTAKEVLSSYLQGGVAAMNETAMAKTEQLMEILSK